MRKSARLITLSIVNTYIGLSIGTSSAFAQSPSGNTSSTSENNELEEIVISVHPLHENGLSQSIEVLRGEELSDALASNLGETLAQQPGIRSASFGAAVGRPVIHGLGGPRVKTTEDRIDSLDVAVTSTDHPVTVEPFIADQITVLKGASTLLYGSGSIGGVVDTQTGRIPTKLNEDAFSGRAEFRASDNGDGRVGALRLDGNAGNAIAWHVDAFSKDGDDYDIPGFVKSEALRNQLAAAGESEEEEPFGVLEGSRLDLQGAAAGISWVGERGHLGISISTSEGVFGLVGAGEEEEEEEGEADELEEFLELEEEGPGIIDFDQTRVDLSAELLNPFSGIESISFRLGVNDYQHFEIEGSGEVGSQFDNEAWEARLHATHTPIAGFSGVLGLQLGDRDFSAVGEEAFVPPAETETAGLYWVGEREFDGFSLELGARVEEIENRSVDSGVERDFSTFSTSFGIVLPTSDINRFGVLLDYSERAPSIEELFSNGPHLATQSFEVGDINLDEEKGVQLSVSWAYETDLFDAHATLYYNDFDDFIFQANTGDIEDGLPVLVYQQEDAEFVGLDLEFGLHLVEVAGGDLDLRATFDTVSAEVNFQANDNLPRIPATRIGADLVWKNKGWRAKLGFANTSSQTDTAAFELPTDSFNDLTAKVEYTFDWNGSQVSAFVSGKNLTDDEQRAHTSFVKDFAPAAGRTFEAGVRVNF